MRNIAKFISPDGSQNLTVSAISGKRGINVKVSVKGVGKNAQRAQTGCRATYASEVDARGGFDKLVKETASRGWKAVAARTRNAFTAIPEPPKSAKPVKGKS